MTDRRFVFDTGPLLCFAGFPRGTRLLADRYDGRAWITNDVDRELRGLRNSGNPFIARAADLGVRKLGWISRHGFEGVDALDALRDLRDQLSTFRRPGRDALRSGKADFGECSVLLLATRLVEQGRSVVAVINEDPARTLASSLWIPSVCFAEILKAMSRDRALPPSAAFEGCQKLKRGFVDVGDVVDSAGYFEQSSAA